MAFKGGYHGDTFGAMSVGLTSGFYEPFKEIVNDSYFFDFPDDWFGNNQIDVLERKSIHQAEKIINDNKNEIAAVIIEPLIQGAGGMKMCRPNYLDKIVKFFKKSGIIVIFDEVMTGFGRTGKMFALDYLSEAPDILCLAKSLTAGYIPLAATVFSENIFNEFVCSDFKKNLSSWSYFYSQPNCMLCSNSIFEIIFSG